MASKSFNPEGYITKKLDSYRRAQEGELGLSSLRSSAQNLLSQRSNVERQLQELPGQVEGESRGFDVNAAQLAAIQQAKQQPLFSNLSNISRSLEGAQGALGSAEATLSNRLGQYASGLSSELGGLLTKWQTGQSMSDSEKNRMNQLAIAEKNNANARELQRMSDAAALQRTYAGLPKPIDLTRFKVTPVTGGQALAGGATNKPSLQALAAGIPTTRSPVNTGSFNPLGDALSNASKFFSGLFRQTSAPKNVSYLRGQKVPSYRG